MRVRLKGINSKTKRLADGRFVTYWWAWKGGPPLRGEPGSPEFIASYNEAIARKVTPPVGVLFSVLQDYQASEDFRGLADRTRRDYAEKITLIEKAFGDFPLSALSDRRTRGVFKAWRDKLAARSRRQADYACRFSAESCRGRLTPAWSRSIHARKVVASIAHHAPTRSGPRMTRPPSSQKAPRTCISRSCLRCGPVSARGISFAYLGQHTTLRTFAFVSQRLGCG
jgi:hypothetical protein